MSFQELLFGLRAETLARHTEFAEKTTNDPWVRERNVPMQVLALGMPRTGTASMQAALRVLGYGEPYHGVTAFAHHRDFELWNPAFETKYLNSPSPACPEVDRAFFDKVHGDRSAVTDSPPAAFAAELIQAYPDAKVVLVERDEDAWYRSIEEVIIKTMESQVVSMIAWLDPSKTGQLINRFKRGVMQGMFHAKNPAAFRRNARPVYRAHYAEIRRMLKERGEERSRLSEFELKDGWEPLCKFLEQEVPAGISFPKVNEREMIQEKIGVMVVAGARAAVGRAVRYLPLVVALLVMCIWGVPAMWRHDG